MLKGNKKEVEEWQKHFQNRILYLLEKENMTQRELAEQSGITEVTLSRYIKGDRVPLAPTIIKIARALKCPVSWLMCFDDVFRG